MHELEFTHSDGGNDTRARSARPAVREASDMKLRTSSSAAAPRSHRCSIRTRWSGGGIACAIRACRRWAGPANAVSPKGATCLEGQEGHAPPKSRGLLRASEPLQKHSASLYPRHRPVRKVEDRRSSERQPAPGVDSVPAGPRETISKEPQLPISSPRSVVALSQPTHPGARFEPSQFAGPPECD